MAVEPIGTVLTQTGNATAITRTGVAATEADSFLVAFVSTFSNWDVTSVTWGADTLTQLGVGEDGGSRCSAGIFYLANPAVESRSLVVNQTSAGRTTIAVRFYRNVDLADPWKLLGSGDLFLENQANSTAPTIALGTVATGELALGLATAQLGTTTINLEGSSGEISDLEVLGSNASNGNAGSAQEVAGAGAGVTMDWTKTTGWWSVIGAVLQEASTSGPTTGATIGDADAFLVTTVIESQTTMLFTDGDELVAAASLGSAITSGATITDGGDLVVAAGLKVGLNATPGDGDTLIIADTVRMAGGALFRDGDRLIVTATGGDDGVGGVLGNVAAWLLLERRRNP